MKKELEGLNPQLDLAGAASAAMGGASGRTSSNGGGDDTTAIFAAYDRNRSGALEFEELQHCLADLGTLVCAICRTEGAAMVRPAPRTMLPVLSP